MLELLLLIPGFLFVIKGSSFLVDGASSLAKRFRISDLAIGLTIVAFGTSLPELVVNIFASSSGETQIAIGNILGSNIANILLILGLSAVIFPLSVTKGTTWKEIPLSLLAALLVGIMASDWIIGGASLLSKLDGLILLLFFAFFLYYVFTISRKPDGFANIESKKYPLGKSLAFILLGLAGLVVGGKWIVEGAVTLALQLGVTKSLIGLTIVAVGTSLPELATSITAALKKNPQIAVGNVVGSNIFNIFFILGVSSIIAPLPFTSANTADIFMAILASLLLFLAMFVGKKHVLEKWQGGAFVAIYAAYIVFLISTI